MNKMNIASQRHSNSFVWHRQEWLYFCGVVSLAFVLRVVFFNGFFGSDDLVYLSRANQIAEGIWSSANYNGALRYGFNIPAGFFIWLFGLNTFSAGLWPLLCSIAEVALVFWFAQRYFGSRTGLYAGLFIATTPLHIALAGRIHTDPVLAFFLTLSFVMLYVAERKAEHSKAPVWYFLAGLSIGMIFWVKELAVVTIFAIATYPIVAQQFKSDWLWTVSGGLVMLLAHFVLMWIIAGDPFHLITTVAGQVQNSFIDAGHGEDGAAYYFWYLLAEIKHTWLLGYFALAGLLLWAMRSQLLVKGDRRSTTYVVWWLTALVAVLTFFPVSLDPLRLVMKQSNYLNLFIAPMAILGAVTLASIPARGMRIGLLATVLAGGTALGAMEQAAYQVFIANSKSAIEFARAHPDDWILGSINNGNMARVRSILERDEDLKMRFGYLQPTIDDIAEDTPLVLRQPEGYVVLDRETQHWGKNSMATDAPDCWEHVRTLEPTSIGASRHVVGFAQRLLQMLPDTLSAYGFRSLSTLLTPRQADVYRVNINNLWCGAPHE